MATLALILRCWLGSMFLYTAAWDVGIGLRQRGVHRHPAGGVGALWMHRDGR